MNSNLLVLKRHVSYKLLTSTQPKSIPRLMLEDGHQSTGATVLILAMTLVGHRRLT